MGVEGRRRILVVENQQYQFEKIMEGLNSFFVYPNELSFINFIDHVRVWVNKGYNSDYREHAFNHIMKCIEEHRIELILMDHILGGAYYCKDGINLATEINETLLKHNKKILPVVFLSKTEHTEKTKIENFALYEQTYKSATKWVHKGFFGEEMLDPKHFETYAVEAIRSCLALTKEQLLWNNIDSLLELEFASNQEEKRSELLVIREQNDYASLSEQFKKSVEDCLISRDFIPLKFD